MPREFSRAERVAAQLRRELSILVQREVKDPGLGFVALSDVEVSRDVSHATVWVTVFQPEQAEASIKALRRAAGFLRSRLGDVLRMRQVPELHFRHDASVETGQRMEELIREATDADADARRSRGGDDDGDGDPEREP